MIMKDYKDVRAPRMRWSGEFMLALTAINAALSTVAAIAAVIIIKAFPPILS